MTVTRVYIASPEGANGRNVVAYGMLNALTSKYKTMVFRPAVSNLSLIHISLSLPSAMLGLFSVCWRERGMPSALRREKDYP